MGALDLVFLEACSVLPQVNALQPVPHVILVPQVEGLLVEGPESQERRAQPGGVRGGWRWGAGAGTGAPHHKADLLRLMGQAEAGGLEDGVGRRGGGSGQAEAGESAERVPSVRGACAWAWCASCYWVAAAWADGVCGAVASLGNVVQLS